MKKYTALALALIMILTMTLAGCGKSEPEPVTPEVTPAETPAAAKEPETVIEPEPEPETVTITWNDLVGEWFLKTMYYDVDEAIDDPNDPGFWDAAAQNVDARITVYASEGIDYFWSTKYSVDDDFEDLPFEIIQEPVSEDETYMDWCITAQPYDYLDFRIGLADADTLICLTHYFDADIELDTVNKCVYTKDGPIQFHKSELTYTDILGTWYQYYYEIEGDNGLCSDTGMDCSITFYDDMTADFYSGNIYYPEDSVYYEGCEVTIVENEPVLGWLSDDSYPDRQDWSVYVDIPKSELSDEETYQFGFTDDYTLTMYLEIVADGGSYHVDSVGSFDYFSPYEGQGVFVSEIPWQIQEYIDAAEENEWVVALANPDEELETSLNYEEWNLSDESSWNDWKNPTEIILAPVDKVMEFEIHAGAPVLDANGNMIDWDGDSFMYCDVIHPGELWRGIVDLPDNWADATLCLYMAFGTEGLDGGEAYLLPLGDFNSEEPYIRF